MALVSLIVPESSRLPTRIYNHLWERAEQIARVCSTESSGITTRSCHSELANEKLTRQITFKAILKTLSF